MPVDGEMREFMQQVVEDLATIKEQNRTAAEATTALEHAVHGNGKEGLLVRVDRLERAETVRAKGDDSRAQRNLVLITAVLGNLSLIGTAIYWLAKHV